MAFGSGRSISEFSLIDCLDECRDVFLNYGGHTLAVGCTLPRESVSQFKERANGIAEARLGADELRRKIRVDAALDFSEIDDPFIDAYHPLSPFGVGNPKPLFQTSDVEVWSAPQLIQGKHLKFVARQDGRSFEAIGWDKADRREEIRRGLEDQPRLFAPIRRPTWARTDTASVSRISEGRAPMLRLTWPRALRTVAGRVADSGRLGHRRLFRLAPTAADRRAPKGRGHPGETGGKAGGDRAHRFPGRSDHPCQGRGLVAGAKTASSTSRRTSRSATWPKRAAKRSSSPGTRSFMTRTGPRRGSRETPRSGIGDLQFESSGLRLTRRPPTSLSTEHGVVFSSPKLNGNRNAMTYSFKEETILLEGDGRASGQGRIRKPDRRLIINGGVLTYRRLERRGEGKGKVGFSLGDSRGQAEAISFRVTDDEQYLMDSRPEGAGPDHPGRR